MRGWLNGLAVGFFQTHLDDDGHIQRNRRLHLLLIGFCIGRFQLSCLPSCLVRFEIPNRPGLTMRRKWSKLWSMQAPIAQVKKQLCELVDLVEAGETVIILRHGRPAARLMPIPGRGQPWRVEEPDDPAIYKKVNIDEPILENI